MNLLPFCFPLRLERVVCAVAALWLCSLSSVRAAPHVSASDDARPSVQVTGTVVNLRAGPGLQHTRRGQAVQGTALRVQGRSADDAWLAVAAPGGGTDVLWIYADLTDVGAQRYVLPWAGPPAVCTRSPDIQAALLTALATQGRSRTCTTVTWADLAALTALPSVVDDYVWLWERHDPAGLTGLQETQVVVTDAYAAAGGRLSGLAGLKRLDLQDACCAGVPWPSHFLAHAPQLQHLTLKFTLRAYTLQALPDHFLAHAPQLQHLTLEVLEAYVQLPADFLAHTPQLHTLDLNLWRVTALPADFLAHAPHLQHLTLKAYVQGLPADVQALPADFLAHAPQLHTLDLDLGGVQALPADFLAHAPQLHTLDLDLGGVQALPADFLTHAPHLQSFTLKASELTTLPADFLAHAPQLHTLDLDLGGVTTLPADFLAYAPHLQHLVLHVPNLNAWPASLTITAEGLQTLDLNNNGVSPPPVGWLAVACLQDLTLSVPWAAEFLRHHASCLRNLDLEISDWSVTRLPEYTLEDVPHLETITLTTRSLTTLPDRFLAHAPQLQRLTLEASNLTALPDRFLAHAPQLQHLTLEAASNLTALPDRFLAHAPQLQRLTLNVFVQALPDHFLSHAPHLHILDLNLWRVTTLPDRFLIHAPQLHTLSLRSDSVTTLPDRFLAHTPQLHTFSLWSDSDSLTPLPDRFLAHVPRLHTLDLWLRGNGTPLPDRFLAHVPRLHTLDLWLGKGTTLPDRFLAHAPRLHTLGLCGGNVAVLPDRFLTHVPRLYALDFCSGTDVTALPDRFLAHAPRLHMLDWELENLTTIGDQVLTHAPHLETFVLNAPRLKTVGESFLARVDRLRELVLLTDGQRPLVLGAQFLAEAPQLETVRLGVWPSPHDQNQSGAASLALPADFLADLPRLTTLQLGPLNDPPAPGFLRGTSLRDLRLRVRIATDAQGAPRLPAVVRAAAWRVELTCDSTYPAAWFAPLATAPPAALTVVPCAGNPDTWQARSQGIPLLPRLPASLSAFLADAPAPIRLQVADAAQLPSDAYASLPVQALEIGGANDIPAAALTITDLTELRLRSYYGNVSDEEYEHAFLWPADLLAPPALRRLTLLGLLSSDQTHWDAEALVDVAELAAAATLAARRAGPGLEAVQLDFSRTSKWGVDTDLRALAAPFAAPAFLIDFKRAPHTTSLKETLGPLLRAPPASLRHLGARTSLAKRASDDGSSLTDVLQNLDFACLQLVLPDLVLPPPPQLRAAARRQGIDLRLIAGSHLQPLDASPDKWTLDAADYFHQHHLPWAAIHSCPRSLLLIDREGVSWGGGRHVFLYTVERLPPDLLDRPGTLQRVRLVFDPRRCPDCEPDAAPEVR